jgi:predicted PolB exonuclease-like 3'-5' exonuclease
VTNLFPEIEQDEHFVVHILQKGTNYQLEVPEYTSLLYKLGPYHFVNTKETVYVDHYTSMSKAMKRIIHWKAPDSKQNGNPSCGLYNMEHKKDESTGTILRP